MEKKEEKEKRKREVFIREKKRREGISDGVINCIISSVKKMARAKLISLSRIMVYNYCCINSFNSCIFWYKTMLF